MPVIPGGAQRREGDPHPPVGWIPFPRLRLAGDDRRAAPITALLAPANFRFLFRQDQGTISRGVWTISGEQLAVNSYRLFVHC